MYLRKVVSPKYSEKTSLQDASTSLLKHVISNNIYV